MNWLCRIWRRLVFVVRRKKFDRELDEEIRFHLEMKVEENLEAGMPLEEARYAAQRAFGNAVRLKEKSHETWSVRWLEELLQDLRYGLRMLRRSPGFAIVAILTLALGIGANTAIFTLLHGLFLRSLPVSRPGELAHINLVDPSQGSQTPTALIPWQMFLQLQLERRSFADISGWSFRGIHLRDNEGTLRMYPAALVTGNAFEVLGMKPYRGRLFSSSDDVRGGPSVGWPVVLSYGCWNDRFNSDPNIIGTQLEISSAFVTVVGVTPPEFHGVRPGEQPRFYLPLQFLTVLDRRDELNSPQGTYFCQPIGRLKLGVGIAQANAEMALYQRDFISRFLPPNIAPQSFIHRATLKVSSARTGLPSFMANAYLRPLLLMQSLVGVVLLLCCVNVGGLMMSKVYARQHEFAVRTAIGAARGRLIRHYLTESFVIAAAGASLGGLAAWFGSRSLLVFFVNPNSQEGLAVSPDKTILLATSFCAVFTTILFGTLPAWRAGSTQPGLLLKSKTTPSGRRQIAGRAFVPIQFALSVVLVVLAALLSRSLIRIRSEQVGFDISHITLTTPLFHILPQKGDALLDLYQRMVDRLEQLPGIQSAAVTWHTPMTGSMATAAFQAVSDSSNSPEDLSMAWNEVGPGYFRTMQTRIIAGREFERNERDRSVCILNQSAANYLFPHQQPLDRYVRSTDSLNPRKRENWWRRHSFPDGLVCRVIGIAEDAKYATARELAPRTIYFPATRDTLDGNLVFLMRSATDAEAMAAYRRALSEIAPTTPLLRFATLQQQMDDLLGAQRLITIMSNVFGGLALFLSAIGLYGLLSASVAQRTGEIGVRMALGARRRTVLKMILYEALGLFVIGISLGLLALLFAVRFVQGMLYGVSPFDPATLFVTAAVLGGVGLFSALIPAIRAASVDPMQALRME